MDKIAEYVVKICHECGDEFWVLEELVNHPIRGSYCVLCIIAGSQEVGDNAKDKDKEEAAA